MTAKRKAAKQPTADDAKARESAQLLARMTLAPEVNAAGIADVFNVTGKPDVADLIGELRERGDAIVRGDTKGIERMLASQAYALNAMFASLARRAKAQENLAPYDAHMKFALRAQSQCRATLETLAAIKNPAPVAFVRQANIANGPQQVNNGDLNKTEHSAFAHARAEQNANRPTELLESPHAKPQWMDAATPGAASGADTPMAAVATIERAKDG